MKKGKSKGFTLVEVLVAVLLISIATTALVASVASATKINATATEKDIAFEENLKNVQMRNEEVVDVTDGTITFSGDGATFEIGVKYYSSSSDKGENLTAIAKG